MCIPPLVCFRAHCSPVYLTVHTNTINKPSRLMLIRPKRWVGFLVKCIPVMAIFRWVHVEPKLTSDQNKIFSLIYARVAVYHCMFYIGRLSAKRWNLSSLYTMWSNDPHLTEGMRIISYVCADALTNIRAIYSGNLNWISSTTEHTDFCVDQR